MISKLWRSLFIGILALVMSFALHASPILQAQTPGSVLSLIQQGREYYDRGQFSAAAMALEQAVQLDRASANKVQQARTLSLLSLVYEQLGQRELVEEYISTSLSLIAEIPASQKNLSLHRIRAQILNRQGRWQLAQGKTETALETLQQAESFYTQSGDIQGTYISQLNQAQAWQTLGFSRRAKQILDRLAQRLQSETPSVIQVNTLNSLGSLYGQQGDLERSTQILTKGLTLAKRFNLESEISKILLSLGNVKLTQASQASDLNDTELANKLRQQALTHYQQAEAIANLPLNRVQARLNQLGLLVKNNSLERAEKLINPITNNLKQLPLSRATIYARINFARSLMVMPNTSEIVPQITATLNKAISQARQLADKRSESFALGTLGNFYETSTRSKLAIKFTTSAIAIAENLDAPDLAYQWKWQLGRLLAREGKTQAALAAYAESIRDLQLLRFDIASIDPELQFSFRDSVEPVYRQYISLLLSFPQPTQDNLKKSIETLEKLKIAELDNLFRDACVQADEIDISQFDRNTAIIYPLVLPERLELILKLPDRDNLYHSSLTNVSKADIDNAVAQLQRSLIKRSTSPSQLKKEATSFYNWLIEPFAIELETNLSREEGRIKNLVFILDGALRNIPMSVLYDGQNYAIARYGIAISPGIQLSDLQIFSREKLRVLLAGAVDSPSFQAQGLAPLDNVAIELAGIAETIPRTEKLEDRKFLQTNIQEHINNNTFDIIHIATHGKFSSNSQETYILDWNKAIGLNDLNYLLEAEDFRKAKAIDLLVLSACETATGDRQAALGLAGVAVRSGANSTIASLWQVNDASTAEFMIELYRQLRNARLSKAEALRNTQLNFLARSDETDYNRPYHWAPFILVGDWR